MEKYIEYYFTFDNDDIILSARNEYAAVEKAEWMHVSKGSTRTLTPAWLDR